MAVENPEAPGGKHQEAGSREQDPHQPGYHLPLGAVETHRDDRGNCGSEGHSQGNQDRDRHPEESRHRARYLPGFLPALLGVEPGVHRNERGAQHPFAEQILEEIGNPEGRGERIRRIGETQVVGQDALPDETGDPAEQNPGGNQRCR